jgi:hypothetical protein
MRSVSLRLGLHEIPPGARPRERHGGALAASELQFVALVEALELTLLLADEEPEKYEGAAMRWHVRCAQETPNVELRASLTVLALLAAVPVQSRSGPRFG